MENQEKKQKESKTGKPEKANTHYTNNEPLIAIENDDPLKKMNDEDQNERGILTEGDEFNSFQLILDKDDIGNCEFDLNESLNKRLEDSKKEFTREEITPQFQPEEDKIDKELHKIILQEAPKLKQEIIGLLIEDLKERDWKDKLKINKKLSQKQNEKILQLLEFNSSFLRFHSKSDIQENLNAEILNLNRHPTNDLEKFILENCKIVLTDQNLNLMFSMMKDHLENIKDLPLFDSQVLTTFLDKVYRSEELFNYYKEILKKDLEEVLIKEDIENIDNLFSVIYESVLKENHAIIKENENLSEDNVDIILIYASSSLVLKTIKKFSIYDDEIELSKELNNLITTLDAKSKQEFLSDLIKNKSLATLSSKFKSKELDLLVYSNEKYTNFFMKYFDKCISKIISDELLENKEIEENEIPEFISKKLLEIKKNKDLSPIENDEDLTQVTIENIIKLVNESKLMVDFNGIHCISMQIQNNSDNENLFFEIEKIFNEVCPKMKNKEDFMINFKNNNYDLELIEKCSALNKKQINLLKERIKNFLPMNKICQNEKEQQANNNDKSIFDTNCTQISNSKNIIEFPKIDESENLDLKRIREKFIGCNPDYDFEIFTKIYNKSGRDVIHSLISKIKNEENESLLDIVMPLLVNQLKVGTDISNIFLDEIFCRKKSSNLYGIDLKTAIACMLERYKSHQFRLINLLKKQTLAIPFIYKMYDIESNQVIYKCPLSAFSNLLSVDNPCVINLGERKIGKTSLLNKIFFTKFYTNKGSIYGGVDICFNCEEYASGFNIFDINEIIHADKILELILNCVTKNSMWIVLHVIKSDQLLLMVEKLKGLGIRESQIIIIFRDCCDIDTLKENEHTLKNSLEDLEKNGSLILNIEKTPNDENVPSFMSSLCHLRSQIFKKTDIGPKAKAPFDLLPKRKNIYWDNELFVKNNIKSAMTQISFHDEEFKTFSLSIDDELNSLPIDVENYQDLLFVYLSKAKQIGALQKSKNDLKNEGNELQSKLAQIDNRIARIDQERKKCEPHTLVKTFNKLFLDEKFNFLQEFDRSISTWLAPIIKPILANRQKLVDKLTDLKKKLNTESKLIKNDSSTIISNLKIEIREVEEKIADIARIIDMKLINLDLFSRELLSIYSYYKEDILPGFIRSAYFESLSKYIIKGNEMEIIDGDNNQMNLNAIEEIFLLVQNKLNWNNVSPFVVAVIGPQSTGKSTLLNMLFGSNFQMSAGRCTKGLYASVFKTEYKDMESLLVLDTEGLLSIERNSEEYDRKLTLFSMACSNIMLINLNGEINSSMKKILTISLFAAKQLNMFKVKPVIIFVLRNMMDLDKSKQGEMISGVNKALAEVVSQASESNAEKMSLCEILDFRDDESFFLMLSAFNKDSVTNQEYGEPVELFQNFKTNNKFSNLISDLRLKIVKIAKQVADEDSNYKNLSSWIKHAGNIWESINYYNDLFLLDSIKEIRERSFLSEKLNEITKNFISNSTENESTLNNDIDSAILSYENSIDKTDEQVCVQLCDIKTRYEELILFNFDEIIKNSNCDVNLIKEYKNNIKSIIESYYNNSKRKLDSIKEKKGIKSILSSSIKSLNSKSQVKIMEWQKFSKESLNQEKKENVRDTILTNLIDELNKEEEKISEKLKNQKKTEQQIKTNVYEMFSLAYKSLPVEKRFFSLNTLYDIRTGKRSKNFIEYLDIKDEKEYLKRLVEIIKKYFRYDDLIKEKNKRESYLRNKIIKEGEKTTSEIDVKLEEKDKGIFKKILDGLGSLFGSKKSGKAQESNKGKKAHHSEYAHFSNPEENLAEFLGPQIISLIKLVFDETNNFLKTDVERDIREKKQYNFNNLKDHLYCIYEKLNELDSKLKPNLLVIKPDFKDNIVSWMYDLICERTNELENIQFSECLSQFTDAKEKVLNNFKERLEKNFGDAENSKEISLLMSSNLKKYTIRIYLIEYVSSLRKTTGKLPKDLLEECYNVFKSSDAEEIYDCVTHFNSYMQKTFEKGFKEIDHKLRKKIELEIQNLFNSEKDKITCMLQTLKNMFRISSSMTPGVMDSEDDSKELFQFLKEYFEDREKAKYLCNKINEKKLFQINWEEDITYCDSSKYIFGKGSDDEMSGSIYSIQNPEFFIDCLLNFLIDLKLNEVDLCSIFETSEIGGQVDEILNSQFTNAKGCMETCPYCGSKCTAIHGEVIDENTRHSTDKHLLMAFKGCYEYSENGKVFVFDLCNSRYNLSQSKWIDSKDPNSVNNSQNDNPEIKQRMTEYGVQGVNSSVRFTVMWNNWNDLDLNVKCPCGTHIYYGNRKCNNCGGYLETDMNVCSHPLGTCDRKTMQGGVLKPSCTNRPIENIIFDNNALTGEYRCWVTMAGQNKQGCGDGASWECQVRTCNGTFLQTITGNYPEKTEVGTFNHAVGVNFLTHAQKYYNNWAGGIKEEQNDDWERDLRASFYIISEKMANLYSYRNNCPSEYKRE